MRQTGIERMLDRLSKSVPLSTSTLEVPGIKLTPQQMLENALREAYVMGWKNCKEQAIDGIRESFGEPQ